MASGSTPRLGLPYPLETDTPDVAADIHSLATALDGTPSRGSVTINTSQSTSSTSFTTLTTPDQVTGIVLPTNGLIAVWYQATWSSSSSGAGSAAIFLGANQLQIVTFGNASPGAQFCVTPNASVNTLATNASGISSNNAASNYTGDVITGQILGLQGTGGPVGIGGPLYVFAAAGTYTVSVQFKASPGSVTVLNRRLYVQALSFA